MNFFKRATTSIMRSFGKSLILLILIFILGVVLSGALFARNAIITAEESLMMQMPAVATLTFDIYEAAEAGLPVFQEQIIPPTREEMFEVGNLPYVRIYDFTITTTFFSRDLLWAEMDIDEERLPETENLHSLSWFFQGARSRGAYIELFTGTGVNNPDITDIAAGLITLVDGRTFTQEEIDNNTMVVVISQAFAATNNLEVGSMIEFENIAHDYITMGREGTGVFELDRHDERFILASQTIEVEVIGIFDFAHEFVYEGHEGWHFTAALAAHSGLYNRIYLPIGIAEDVMNFVIVAMDDEMREVAVIGEEPWLQSIFVLYDPRNLEDFSVEASALLPEFWGTGDVSAAFDPVVNTMDTMLQIADLVHWSVIGVSITVLTLVIILFLRDRRHEIGIYMALGEKKLRMMFQILTEIVLIALVAITLALFVGNVLSDGISRQMFEQRLTQQMEESRNVADIIPWELALFNPGVMSIEDAIKMYDVSLDIGTITTFIGVGIAVILVSTIIPIWYIAKLEPREVLM